MHGNAAARKTKRSVVGILLPTIGLLYEAARNPKSTLRNRIRGYVGPSDGTSIRGIGVASANLLKCLLPRETGLQYEMYAGISLDRAAAFLRTQLGADNVDSTIRLVDLRTLVDRGLPTKLGAWLETASHYQIPYQLRDQLSDVFYPIVSTVHGLSIHNLLYEKFLRVILCETYEGDTFVCTTETCRQALRKLLGHVEETLELALAACGKGELFSAETSGECAKVELIK